MSLILTVAALNVFLLGPSASGQTACPPFPTTPPDINNPTQLAQTAWQIFVAMNCKNNPNTYPFLVWETWPTQEQVYPASQSAAAVAVAKKRGRTMLRGSFLRSAQIEATGRAPAAATCDDEICPSNVPLFEEVRLNPVAAAYVQQPAAGATLAFRSQQAAYATAGGAGKANINFPPGAIEIKANWVEYKGACPACLQGKVWTETRVVDSVQYCYALAGLHVISKLLPNWIWATFEPQSRFTNPNRCVVLGCNDPFGSLPAQTPPKIPGIVTAITPALQNMMTAAGLDPVWQNYRLNGVQVNFTDGNGNPTLLGSSVIECENAGVPLTSSSCMTCHAVSSIDAQRVDGIKNLNGFPVGNPPAYPAGFSPRDFVWSLMLACPGGFGNVNCPQPSGTAAAKKKKK